MVGVKALHLMRVVACFLTLGSHLIDQALVLFGKPQQVYAEIMHRRPGVAGDDDTFVALRFADAVVVHIWVSMLAPEVGPRFRLIGIEGTYEKWGLDPSRELPQRWS
jgi:scyllo-inositol 2-dehydrogenase (NADP+)